MIQAEGFDPANPVAQQATVTYLHRPETIYVGSDQAAKPRYRVIPSVPEGKYTDTVAADLVPAITDAFANAEGTTFDDIAARVSVFPTEIPEGRWGGRGKIHSIIDTQARLSGNPDTTAGTTLLATHRRTKALEILDTINHTLRNHTDPT